MKSFPADTITISGYWLTLALVVAGIAQGKNRSGLGWFFLSFLFGPFALFFLLLLGKLEES